MNTFQSESAKLCHQIVVTSATALFMLALASCVTIIREDAVLSAEYINEGASYPSCHASTIAETEAGGLVAAWFGGTRERDPDVGIWVSRMEDGRWLPASEVANGLQADGTRFPTWNPVLFQPPAGDLLLFYKVGPNPREWWGMVMTSADGGKTWSAAERLPDGIIGPVKNKPVALPDGTWISPSSTEDLKDGWNVHLEVSHDQGQTWQVVGPISRGVGLDAIQPSVLLHGDGVLQLLCRTKQGCIGMAWSYDNGETWTEMAATELPNPNSGTDAVTLQDGRQLVVYNHSGHMPERSGKGLRYPLNVAVSDDGLKWRRVLDLETEALPAGYAYPAVIQTRDGRVHITYTHDRKRIKHVVIDPKRILQ